MCAAYTMMAILFWFTVAISQGGKGGGDDQGE